MANEIQINSSIIIKKGNLTYSPARTQFTADITNAKGPSPGAIAVAVSGTNVDFSELDTPTFCRITNLDATNFVTVGVYDGASFFPFLELLPGESFTVRLSRYLNEEFVGTGTNSDANTMRIYADTAACNVSVEAFSR